MTRTPPWLLSILEEHFEEIQMLWELRRDTAWDVDYTEADIAHLEDRIEAHVDGLVISRDQALPLLLEGLASDDSSAVFAAAFVLLRLNDQPLAGHVIGALPNANDEQRNGLSEAICYAQMNDALHQQLVELAQSAAAPVAAVCIECLACHGRLDTADWQSLFEHETADVRRRAWRAAACVSRTS